MQQEIPDTKQKNNRHLLTKYGGLAMQWMVVLLVTVLGGRKLDHWLRFKKPLLAWILPVLGLVGLLYNIIRDTSPTKNK